MFVVVAYHDYYPEGGVNDFAGVVPLASRDEAINLAKSIPLDYDHVLVYELIVGEEPKEVWNKDD